MSEFDETLSLLGQIGSLVLGYVVGRYRLRSRTAILAAAFLGAFGAMAAHMSVDGQGAVFLLALTPVIYFAAIYHRRDLRL